MVKIIKYGIAICFLIFAGYSQQVRADIQTNGGYIIKNGKKFSSNLFPPTYGIRLDKDDAMIAGFYVHTNTQRKVEQLVRFTYIAKEIKIKKASSKYDQRRFVTGYTLFSEAKKNGQDWYGIQAIDEFYKYNGLASFERERSNEKHTLMIVYHQNINFEEGTSIKDFQYDEDALATLDPDKLKDIKDTLADEKKSAKEAGIFNTINNNYNNEEKIEWGNPLDLLKWLIIPSDGRLDEMKSTVKEKVEKVSGLMDLGKPDIEFFQGGTYNLMNDNFTNGPVKHYSGTLGTHDFFSGISGGGYYMQRGLAAIKAVTSVTIDLAFWVAAYKLVRAIMEFRRA